jgi:septal ring factor EnvC (AmiA/AmiB activator)
MTALVGFVNGCVAYQIRDELRITNSQLATVNAQLKAMAADLKEVDASVRQSSPILQKSNHSLGVMENSMEPIRISLRRIDDEMAGFRQMIDKIDKYIPLDIKADTPPPVKQAPTHETTPQK